MDMDKVPSGRGSSPGWGSTRWYLGLREGNRGKEAGLVSSIGKKKKAKKKKRKKKKKKQ